MKRKVLINPLVYASEGFRSAFVPNFPHLPTFAIIVSLIGFNLAFLGFGLRQFRRKAVT